MQIPGHGDAARAGVLRRSIEMLRRTLRPSGMCFDCRIFLYKKTSHPLPPGCTLVSQQGLWTNFILDVPVRDHKYVAILMDDVDASNVDLASFVRTLEAHSLDMAAAAVDSRWHWTVMMPSEDNCVVREVQYADTLFSVFKAKSFECWRGQIDLTVNPSGWGYDATFPSRCGASIGVLDHHRVTHTGKERTYDGRRAQGQLRTYLGNWLNGTEGADAYMQRVMSRAHETARCIKTAPLHLASEWYYRELVTHRGGWKDIIGSIIARNIASAGGAPHPGIPLLVDCPEVFFVWHQEELKAWGKPGAFPGGEILRQPWVGIVHTLGRGDGVPANFALQDSVHSLLTTTEFVASLDNCMLLIALSTAQAETLRAQTLLKGVPVETVLHPIAPSLQQSIATQHQCQPAADSHVVLLGLQYRRIATIYKLRVGMRKMWLPGVGSVDERLQRFFVAAMAADGVYNVSLLPNGRVECYRGACGLNHDQLAVRLHRTPSYAEYDSLLCHSIVVVDLFAASANNAVLEVIALNVPALVRRLPATEEYLGAGYPLFFESFEHLQRLLSDSTNLFSEMARARRYLKDLAKQAKEPAHPLNLETFGRRLIEVAALHNKHHGRRRLDVTHA